MGSRVLQGALWGPWGHCGPEGVSWGLRAGLGPSLGPEGPEGSFLGSRVLQGVFWGHWGHCGGSRGSSGSRVTNRNSFHQIFMKIVRCEDMLIWTNYVTYIWGLLHLAF